MTESQLNNLLGGIADATKTYVARYTEKQLAPLLARIAQLETELADYRAMGALADKGVWRADTRFERGDTVTDRGSLWICQRSTMTRPGGPDGTWRLAAKRGRDGRDAT